MRILDVDKWALSAGGILDYSGQNVGEHNRFDAVQAERLHPRIATNPAGQVYDRSRHNRAGIAEKTKSGRRGVQESVGLRCGILQARRDLHIDRSDGGCADCEHTDEERVLSSE